jgi:predicted nucleotidyltransferase
VESRKAEVSASGRMPVVPDVNFSEEQIAAAQAVLDREIGADSVRCAFLSGSLAVGLGHALSDIDIYFVAESASWCT